MKFIKMTRKKFVIIGILILSVILTGILFKDTFTASFFQDDWFSLRISNAKSISDVLTFFIPRTDVIYYRPIGMQVPFFILQKVFGINSIPFHYFNFIIHALNVVLVFILIKLFFKDNLKALFISFLYSISSIHYIPFYWMSTFSFVLGPTFTFLSMIYLLKYIQKSKTKYYFLSCLTFFLGLFTNEMIIIMPLIFLSYILIFRKSNIFKKLLPLIFIGGSYFIIRYIFFPPPTSGNYQIEFGKQVLSNVKTYILWSFGWSEVITEQMVHLLVFNIKFLSDFYYFVVMSLLTLFVSIYFFYILPITMHIRNKNIESIKIVFFGLCWFIIGILPVIFFSAHKFSYYLPISMIGFLLVSVSLFQYLLKNIFTNNKILTYILVISMACNWIIISKTTIDFNLYTHWAPRRAEFSKIITEKAIKYYPPGNPEYPNIYIKPDSEAILTLNNQDAFKVIFQDEKITTVYGNMIKKYNLGIR